MLAWIVESLVAAAVLALATFYALNLAAGALALVVS